jgi:rod shape-determining protein MreC
MSLRDSQFGELKVPLTWTAAVALIVAAVIAIGLLLTDRRETFRAEAYGMARNAADTVLAPVGDALSAPGRWTGAGIDAVRSYFFAVSENRELKGELRDMRQWRDVALALKNENGRYRSLLGLKTDPPIPMVAARVVTDSRGPFADTRIANTGKEAGVKVGNPVMSEYGLVGRVIGVTTGASRVLLLTDVASRTPVMVDRTNARAILTGDGGPNPRLDYLRGQDPVREGDRILTSGDGGVLPRGLPVGVAVKGLDGKWRVVMAADKGPIDFVRILLFQDFTEVINRKELDETPVPPPTPGVPPSNAAPDNTDPLAAAAARAQAAAAAAKAAGAGAAPAAGAAAAATAAGAKPAELKPGEARPATASKPAADKPKPAAENPALRTAAGKADGAHPAKPAAAKSAAEKTAAEKSGAVKAAGEHALRPAGEKAAVGPAHAAKPLGEPKSPAARPVAAEHGAKPGETKKPSEARKPAEAKKPAAGEKAATPKPAAKPKPEPLEEPPL